MHDDVESAARALERLAHWLRAVTRSTISATTVSALDTLAREGRMRVSDLAAGEGISQPGMTALVNRLTEAGWAVKLADETDRRVTLVAITETGRAALAERRAARISALADGIRELDQRHQQLLLDAREALDELTRRPSLRSATPVGVAS